MDKSTLTAESCTGCNGCKHQHARHGSDWCYMFETAPDVLPCGQHDQFKAQREATGKLLRKHPVMFIGFANKIDVGL